MNEDLEYCRAIESYLCRKNDGHLIRIVGPSFELVAGWAEQGVPFKVACRGIDRYFERYYAKEGRRRPVRIEFCEADVLDVFDEWKRAVGVSVAPWATNADVKAGIETLLRERRNVGPQDADNFRVLDLTEVAGVLENVTGALTLFLGAIAAVSLLVGGVGIMNIMLVSVTERTREIGTRLAVGAMASDVLLQFLIEAVTLAAFGGIIGIELGL